MCVIRQSEDVEERLNGTGGCGLQSCVCVAGAVGRGWVVRLSVSAAKGIGKPEMGVPEMGGRSRNRDSATRGRAWKKIELTFEPKKINPLRMNDAVTTRSDGDVYSLR